MKKNWLWIVIIVLVLWFIHVHGISKVPINPKNR
jgi:uncharacterized membrane protein